MHAFQYCQEVSSMKLTWLGTSGFRVEAGNCRFLIDPYLTRNSQASPAQALRPADLSGVEHIFITHGHFDHLYDVPAIMAGNTANVYCSEVAAATLKEQGADISLIHAVKEDGYRAEFDGCRARAFFSRHVKFDIPLVARALLRIGTGYRRLSGMSNSYPPGQVLSWRFNIGGYTMHHFGSAGSTHEELARFAGQRLDLLLVPLQGHSHICDIAFEYVRVLKPGMVIPHHQDDFYPPISTSVDIQPFINKVATEYPQTLVRVMQFNETISL
jgi:L-ascorbate metabolism protein UlaG (beta-lactamase superfamily)